MSSVVEFGKQNKTRVSTFLQAQHVLLRGSHISNTEDLPVPLPGSPVEHAFGHSLRHTLELCSMGHKSLAPLTGDEKGAPVPQLPPPGAVGALKDCFSHSACSPPHLHGFRTPSRAVTSFCALLQKVWKPHGGGQITPDIYHPGDQLARGVAVV